MMDTLINVIVASFGALAIGFLTIKFTFYGGLATVGIWTLYAITPTFSADEVWTTMWPRFIDLWLLYPSVFQRMIREGSANFGELGVIIYGGVTITIAAPYVVGIWFGLTRWPGLFLLRVML